MRIMLAIIIIGLITLFGYFLPKKYNEFFYNKYHEKIISTPLATATAIFSFLWLLLMDSEEIWYWILLIAAVSLCIISVLYVIYTGLQVRSSVFEIIFAILAQILATAGVLIFILFIVGFVMEIFGGKKKRKR
ncbi:MAG: hypothetical protein IKV25_03150 [Clostridia bacterium]|nr:hypothetical protein [Clostridia bacterium]